MRATIVAAVVIAAAFAFTQTRSAAHSAAYASMQRKLQHVENNARQPHPDPTPTEFTEQEVNAYLASGDIQFPAGVQSAELHAQPGVVNGLSRVDFDQVKAGRSSANPLLAVFTGVHDVQVMTHAHGAGGRGYVHVDSVSIDGIEVPTFVLQLFIDKYIKPKYPNVGIDSEFALPDRVDSAVVGLHKVTVVQK
jgi:hypothetical protein